MLAARGRPLPRVAVAGPVFALLLLPALLDEPGFAERFRGEARTMATINHPGAPCNVGCTY